MAGGPEWDYDAIITNLRNTQCSLLLERFFESNTLLHVAARLGHVQIVDAILSNQECQQELLTATNSTGELPLHVAANAGHLPIVVQFLGRPCSKHQELLRAPNSNGDLPLHVAANAGHLSIVQHLVESHLCQELLVVKNSNGDLPLHVAANAGHLSIVQHLVESSDSSHQCLQELLLAKNSSGDHPLHVAANAGHLYIVQHLLNSSQQEQNLRANVASKLLTGKNKEGNTPLHLALIKKYEQVDMNLKSKYNEVAKFLIETDPIVVSKKEKKKKVPIVFKYRNKAQKDPHGMAIEAEDKELLVMMKPKLANLPSERNAEMGRKAALLSDVQMESEVINPHKPKDKFMDPSLYRAVNSKDIDFINVKAQDLEHGHPFLSETSPELNTILHLAAARSDDDHQFVRAILDIPLCENFVTKKNSNGDLPLHVAASAGNMQIVILLAASVPLAEKNMEENTPLHLALIKKFQVGRNSALKAKYNKVARFLIEKCPEVSFYPNKERKSPLYLAAEGGDEELVKNMITKNDLPHGKSIVHAATYYLMTIANLPYGKSIVHTAIYGSFTARKKGYLGVNIYSCCTKRKKDILVTVLESLPNDILTVKDDKGMTPLFYAASIGYLKGVESFLGKTTKSCVYERDKHGYYPIHIASKKGHIKVVEKLLHIYPDMIELLTEEGQNILHVAAMNGKAKVVAYMLKMHDLKVEMLVNNEDKNGNTPLHLASMKGHPDVVSVLTWDKRVHLKSLNKDGKRALDIAKKYSGENPSIKERLTWEVLRYVSGPGAPPPPRPISGENQQISKVGKPRSTDKYKERVGTLLLVATLVATLTFAAAFTMPGGYNGPGGVATFREKHMFHVFVISNAIAMYSAITVVVALSWAHLGDHDLLIAAFKFTVPIMGLALTMVSVAFMAGNYLVLRDLNWLADLVLSVGSFSLFIVWVIFLPFCFQSSYPHIIRDILRCSYYRLIKFFKGDTDDREEE